MPGTPICNGCGDAERVIKNDTEDRFFCHRHGYSIEQENCNHGEGCNPVNNRYYGFDYWCEHCNEGIEKGCRDPYGEGCYCPEEENNRQKTSGRKFSHGPEDYND